MAWPDFELNLCSAHNARSQCRTPCFYRINRWDTLLTDKSLFIFSKKTAVSLVRNYYLTFSNLMFSYNLMFSKKIAVNKQPDNLYFIPFIILVLINWQTGIDYFWHFYLRLLAWDRKSSRTEILNVSTVLNIYNRMWSQRYFVERNNKFQNNALLWKQCKPV